MKDTNKTMISIIILLQIKYYHIIAFKARNLSMVALGAKSVEIWFVA